MIPRCRVVVNMGLPITLQVVEHRQETTPPRKAKGCDSVYRGCAPRPQARSTVFPVNRDSRPRATTR